MFGPKPGASSTTSTTKAAVTRTVLNTTTPATQNAVPKKPLSAATMSRLQRSNSSASAPGPAGGQASTSLAGGGLKSTSRSSLLSDTTLSVCSLASSQATGSSRAQPRPGAIKKSSSSLSAGGAPTNLSFSGIKRPISSTSNGRGSGSAKIASSIASSSSASAATHSTPGSSNSSCGGGSMASQSRRVPTLAMSLRDKDQQIKLLIKERDEKKFQAELMARQVNEWREKFEASELERSHVTSEADDEVIELRRLAQEFEDENKTLAQRLAQREQAASDLQFKFDELQCERDELQKELEFKETQLKELEEERHELAEGQKSGPEIVTERAISRAKYEREIEELKEKIVGRDEQIMQLRTSLEMRKNEVQNLQQHTADLERKLRIECERSERHLKRIDEVNLELKAAEAKLNTKTEENEIQEAQIKQLRHELRQTEEKLEQVSLARRKDVDMLHSKLSAARRGGSTTPSGSGRGSPATSGSGLGGALPPFKTPTPQDEIVRLQMEIRDLKDQLIDREAELDCNRRDLEVMRRKMETRTLEVDCNNQELARRCQDLLEQNRQSEDTIKQLLRSTTEHSASLMRATEDLKEANGKCLKLREEINELEMKLDEQLKQNCQLKRENKQLSEGNAQKDEQVDLLRQQVEALNEQIGELCGQLEVQTKNLHKDRETLADQLSEHEINSAQLRHDLASARQDLRTQKLQQKEVASERDRLKSDLEMREKYIKSRNEVLETMRLELDDCKRSLADHKSKLESLRATSQSELDERQRELKDQIELLKGELQLKLDECSVLKSQNVELQSRADEASARRELAVDEEFDAMRRKHSAEIDELHARIQALEEELEEARTSTLKSNNTNNKPTIATNTNGSQTTTSGSGGEELDSASKLTYEGEIQFLNSLVVDMQRKCDTYKSQLAQMERDGLTSEFDKLLAHQERHSPGSSTLSDQQQQQAPPSRASTLKRPNGTNGQTALKSKLANGSSSTLTRQRVVRIQDPLDELLTEASCAPIPPTRHISGRPFCDICQVYDTHHTIYCPKVNEKLAAHIQASAADSQSTNNNNGVFPNGYQTADDMFRECVAELEGASGPKLAGSIAPFASLRRPPKQEHGERMRLH